jgi:hypothetical protein
MDLQQGIHPSIHEKTPMAAIDTFRFDGDKAFIMA